MNAWDVFWFLFVFVPLTIIWVIALVDVFGRRDLVGWKKAMWVMAIVFFPWIGVLSYLIFRPREIALPAYAGAAPAPTAGQTARPPTQPAPVSYPAGTPGAMS